MGTDLAPLRDHGSRHLEWPIPPAQGLACLRDFLRAERRAVRFLGALSGRRAISDHRAACDQRRTIAFAGGLDRRRDRLWIMAVDPAGRPARCLEPRDLIVRA